MTLSFSSLSITHSLSLSLSLYFCLQVVKNVISEISKRNVDSDPSLCSGLSRPFTSLLAKPFCLNIRQRLAADGREENKEGEEVEGVGGRRLQRRVQPGADMAKGGGGGGGGGGGVQTFLFSDNIC